MFNNMQFANNKDIYNYLFIKTPIKPADILLVFGTSYGIDEYVQGIFNIINNNMVKTIIITGKDESNVLYKAIQAQDKRIDEKVKIFVENESTNTEENIQCSLKLLRYKNYAIDKIKSVIGLGKDFASRRFLMTMAKYFPTANRWFYPINVYHVNPNNWFQNKTLYQKCMEEIQKIPRYLAKGYINNIQPYY